LYQATALTSRLTRELPSGHILDTSIWLIAVNRPDKHLEDLMQTVESLRPPVAVASGYPAWTGSGARGSRLAWASIALASIWLATTPASGQSTAPGGASGLLGRWLTDNGNLEIEIAPCGAAFCGTVTKVLANRSMSGGGEMVAADNRSPLGIKILKDFEPSGDGEWNGEIYNRENAKTYSCKITLGGADQLIVHPYIGLPMFGKTLIWKRVATQTGEK
jgi:uncharacterized protein (DUF2147 family)